MMDVQTAKTAAAALTSAALELPSLAATNEQLQAENAYLRRALWLFHGCHRSQRTQDARIGSWGCLSCGVDFGLGSELNIIEGLHRRDVRLAAGGAVRWVPA